MKWDLGVFLGNSQETFFALRNDNNGGTSFVDVLFYMGGKNNETYVKWN